MYYKKNLFRNAGKHNKYLYTGCPFHTGNIKSVNLRNYHFVNMNMEPVNKVLDHGSYFVNLMLPK